MKIIKNIFLASMVVLFVACDNDDYVNDGSVNETIQLKLLGKGEIVGQPTTVVDPVNGENLEVLCFTMDMFNAETNELIGTLVDCELATTEFENGNILSRVLTTFNIDGKGSITAESQVLQEPINDEGLFTTKFDPLENNVVATSGEFANRKGKASLDGQVDLSKFFEEGTATFECVFTIDLETYK